MNNQEQEIAQVELVAGGGVFSDPAGKTHFLKGYGGGKETPFEVDPALDLTSPIWEQLQTLGSQLPLASQKASSSAQ